MATVKAWKQGTAGEPSFPAQFEIVKKAVLQVTDIKTNRNKYYAIELHAAGNQFRVFTHYGRTDDLESNPNAGVRESRYLPTLPAAQAAYEKMSREKTSASKGYKELNLASSRIGSEQARGKSSGHVDAATLGRIEGDKSAPRPAPKKSELPDKVQDFVRYLYEEATTALTSTIAARITAQGIETPLGVLTLGQIEKGELILAELFSLFQTGKQIGKRERDRIVDLSGDFYTSIPHRIGRTRKAVEDAVIDSLGEFNQKQETLQLMRDMLAVNGDGGSVLFEDEIDQKYGALACNIGWLEPTSSQFRELKSMVEKSQVKTKSIQVQRIYSLKRDVEHDRYLDSVGNHQLLFHGSRAKNWVGILSHGILLPKIVVSMGVNRTDAGWLGNGIYFGNAACTTLYYTAPGKRQTRMMAIARVALGKSMTYRQITYGIESPPAGYHSCHGVRATRLRASQFEDDEFVVYKPEQQRLEYLVEYTYTN